VAERRILRYEVPVDDQWHVIDLPRGPILYVACRVADVVEFWALDAADGITLTRAFRVFGTGQPLPRAVGRHIGTAFAAGGRLVWHLMEHEVMPPGGEPGA
jgi:hypothetical protein